MNRIPLTDGTGRWFDASKAEEWDEDTRWDGNNHISIATGSQWHHERLYRTAGGVWIMHSSSNNQGSKDEFDEISADAAAACAGVGSGGAGRFGRGRRLRIGG